MAYLDLTLPTPEENLALDEALLEDEQAGSNAEVLRVWEAPAPWVVLGRSNRADAEVDLDACARLGWPVLRRCSGGGAVLLGPGCLNYALVLNLEARPGLESVTVTNHTIMETHRGMLEQLLGRPVRVQGITDLTDRGRKVSGNSQKRGRARLLFHGTFLLDFDLERMDRVLRSPSRPPAYRSQRGHEDFTGNLGIDRGTLEEALRRTWGAVETFGPLPEAPMERLLKARYRRAEWHAGAA